MNNAHYPGVGNAQASGGVDPNATLVTDTDKKDHTILRQIFNPSGNKRDDVAFGTTAQVTGGNTDARDTTRSDHLGTTAAAAGAS